MSTLADAVWRWWWLDPYLHSAVFTAAIIGSLYSAWAWLVTWRRWQLFVRVSINGPRRNVLRLHLVTHTGIWLCQVILMGVSVAMLYLPATPVAMYHDAIGRLVLLVLFGRKLARLATSLILLAISAYQVRWMHHAE